MYITVTIATNSHLKSQESWGQSHHLSLSIAVCDNNEWLDFMGEKIFRYTVIQMYVLKIQLN